MMDETTQTILIDTEDVLRIEKALRSAAQFLDEDTPPSVREDVRNALSLVEDIRGR